VTTTTRSTKAIPTPENGTPGSGTPGSRRSLRTRLAARETLAGTFVKSRDPSTTEALAVGGLDFVIADLEHSPLSVQDVEAIARVGAAWNLPVLARIPPARLALVGALLDAGAAGIQVSDVTSVDLAQQAEAAAHYPPRGQRSLSLATRAGSFGTISAAEHIAASNWETVLIGQIESVEGLAALTDIIAAEAFNALFIGPADLSLSLGHPGDLDHPTVADALTETAATIVGSGTPLGIACPAGTAAQWAAKGATLLAISTDVGFLASAAATAIRSLRP
jgi:2-keto-3-deoxy-L-rhamnonate aldolase RhmA